VAALIPEVATHELFDDMPCWDSDAEKDDLPSSVIWDEELWHDFESHEMLSEVIWDEGEKDMLDQHGLLKKLTLGVRTRSILLVDG
jgi:hypothetical protein